jgi:CheY-like chemotaxis protein
LSPDQETIRQLQDELQKATAGLSGLARELEDQVVHRTRDLSAQNRELERQVAERAAQVVAANQSKSIALTTMAHEMRAPLHAILGFSQLLLRTYQTPKYLEFVENINRAGEDLLALAERMLGAGTTAPAFPPQRRVARLQAGQKPVKVLVVADRDMSRLLLVRMLRAVGFLTAEAGDGPGALALLESWQPRAVVLDSWVAGLGAFEILRRIKAAGHGAAVPVIAVTAGTFPENSQVALEAGADDCIGKPVREEELYEKLRVRLNLAYDYSEATAEPRALPGDDPLPTEAMAPIPADLRAGLRTAVLEADYQRILELIDRIQEVDAHTAAALRSHARQFAYHALLDELAEN